MWHVTRIRYVFQPQCGLGARYGGTCRQCLVRYCWRYLSGELDELGDPFEVAAAAAAGTEGEQSAPTDR